LPSKQSERPASRAASNGPSLGPVLRLHRGDEVEIAVANAMPDLTAVHWHGLLIPAESDGGPHQVVQPGTTWRPRLKIDQPAATLWYHAHPHGATARQVYEGLAGAIIVDDRTSGDPRLPSRYGVDDLLLILQDRLIVNGQKAYPDHPMTLMMGARGDTVHVNGAPDVIARVPAGLVRLRLVNGSNARVYDLSFTDGVRSIALRATQVSWRIRLRTHRCSSRLASVPNSWSISRMGKRWHCGRASIQRSRRA
jgi:FtsP/CotA-like multicopper oxidase with cupredoxin domain